MKNLAVCLVVVTLIAFYDNVSAQHHHSGQWASSKKSPAIAAALSLQPLPVDLGSFYAGNWERGIVYTAAEIALFVPAVVLLAENSNWGHHRYDAYYYGDPARRTWTNADRNRFYYIVGGYFLIKVISAFDAGLSVEHQNAKISIGYSIGYNEQNKSFAVSLAIPILAQPER